MTTISKTLVAFSAVGLIAATSLVNSASAMEGDRAILEHAVNMGNHIVAAPSSDSVLIATSASDSADMAVMHENRVVRTSTSYGDR